MKDSNRVSGRGRITCPFYDELDAVLGTRAASTPAVLLESSGDQTGRSLKERSTDISVISLYTGTQSESVGEITNHQEPENDGEVTEDTVHTQEHGGNMKFCYD